MKKKYTIQDKFRAAAKYFEEVYKKNIGRGYQARVSEKSRVRAPYFNEILKGKKDGPEEIRRKLVEAISSVCPEAKNLNYEQFLDLGEYLLDHGTPKGWNPNSNIDVNLPEVIPNNTLVKSDIPPYFAAELVAVEETIEGLVAVEETTEEEDHAQREHSPIYEFSPRDKKDKNMLLIAEWINQQEEPSEYWTLLKMFLRREEPEFREWLKKRSAGGGQDRLPENKSAVGE